LQAAGVVVLRAPERQGAVDLAAMLKLVAERGITRLMVEGGPTLAAALLTADRVDEAALFQSAKVVGADGIDALEGLPLTALTHSPRLLSVRSVAVGADICDIFWRRT
jgi:diaminohydroxyphosphoribosylaminopyrimidine deaminase/5-amino-6-(5-phosphoribosylamino)uracil reductase